MGKLTNRIHSIGFFKTEEVRIIILTIIVALGIISFGVIGYMVLEGWNFLDSLYQTVITISTVGLEAIHPLTPKGKILTIFIIIFALSLLAYFFSKFVTIMVEGRILTILRGRKMEKKISRLKDHFIICGFGRMGRQVASEFQQANVPYVVLDKNSSVFERELDSNMLYMVGDANRDEDLELCGIRHARGIVSVLTEDQDNVYAVLTARGLNPDIRIVTRANEIESEGKLRRAGANQVIYPFQIGGSRIASTLLRPSITHFLDGLAKAEEIRLTLIEIEIKEGSLLDGKTIFDTGITDVSESIIVGLRRPGQPIEIRPSLKTQLQIGDQIVLMGQLDAMNRVDEIVDGMRLKISQ